MVAKGKAFIKFQAGNKSTGKNFGSLGRYGKLQRLCIERIKNFLDRVDCFSFKIYLSALGANPRRDSVHDQMVTVLINIR